MSPAINTEKFYGDEELSDITLKFSGRQFRGHKFILCTQSEFFKTMLGPRGRFAEKDQAVVELKDDDPDGLDAVLRFIYTSKYVNEKSKKSHWSFHLHVSETANKYILKDLDEQAFSAFKNGVTATTDTEEVVNIIETLPTIDHRHADLQLLVQELREKYFTKLLRHQRFRDTLKTDPDLMLSHIDRLAVLYKLKKKTLLKCSNCKQQMVVADSVQKCTHCSGPVRRYEDLVACWVEDTKALG